MTAQPAADEDMVVIDTNIASALLVQGPLAAKYSQHVAGRRLVISFVTVAELRYGALNGKWGQAKKDALEEKIQSMIVVGSDNDLTTTHAQLREHCRSSGHGLHNKIHEADRWIAATALRHGLTLVSDDKIFDNVVGLNNIRVEAKAAAHSSETS